MGTRLVIAPVVLVIAAGCGSDADYHRAHLRVLVDQGRYQEAVAVLDRIGSSVPLDEHTRACAVVALLASAGLTPEALVAGPVWFAADTPEIAKSGFMGLMNLAPEHRRALTRAREFARAGLLSTEWHLAMANARIAGAMVVALEERLAAPGRPGSGGPSDAAKQLLDELRFVSSVPVESLPVRLEASRNVAAVAAAMLRELETAHDPKAVETCIDAAIRAAETRRPR